MGFIGACGGYIHLVAVWFAFYLLERAYSSHPYPPVIPNLLSSNSARFVTALLDQLRYHSGPLSGGLRPHLDEVFP
jgi:hypothetical protein